MFCSRCGNEIKGDGKFCPKCGAPIKPVQGAPNPGAGKERLPAEPARITVIIREITAREVMPRAGTDRPAWRRRSVRLT